MCIDNMLGGGDSVDDNIFLQYDKQPCFAEATAIDLLRASTD